ncbi:translocation/assembly module TamB domain-containing protein [Rhodoligotrophos defluvii]|uniref:translocation/assembly module TamB domain-containing protein n=1 Tax=Rhodoligotrophos defluvii TaxID=2561934 RepID=UPI0010C93FB2|nr:translocation/assembly module TamB domain-containing protein [Rhodoligotrophos defluvii]
MIRKVLKWAAIGLGSVLLLVCIGLGVLLGTLSGRNMVAGIAENMANAETFGLAIGRIEGSSLSDLQVDELVLRDAQGPWLRIHDLTLRWNPLALLAGRFEASELAAEQVQVARRPVPAETESQSTSSLPPVGIKLDQLAVRRLDLEAPVLGAPVVLAIGGSLSFTDPHEPLSGTLRVDRRDGAGGHLEAQFGYRHPDQSLNIDARFSEPKGGIIANLMGLPGDPETAGRIVGGGTLDAWRAELSLDAGTRRLVAGSIQMQGSAAGRRITAGLGGSLAYLMPQAVQGLFAGESRLMAQADWAPDGTVVLHDAELASRSARIQLSGTGDLNLNLQRAQLTAELADPDGGMIAIPLAAGSPLVLHNAKLTAELGSAEGPAPVTANLVGNAIAMPEGQIGTATATFSGARQDASLASLWSSLRGKLRVALEQPRPADPALQGLLGKTVTLDARFGLSEQGASIDEAALNLGTGAVRYSGLVNGKGADGTVSLAVQDLAAISGLTGMGLSGGGNLTASGKIGFGDLLFALKLDGSFHDLGVTAADGTRQEIPGVVKLAGTVARQPDGGFAIQGLKLDGEGISAAIDGVVDESRTNLAATGHIGNLALLSPRLAGAADISVNAQGTPEQARYALKVAGTGVRIEGQPFDNPTLTFTGEGALAAPRGELVLGGRFQGRELTGRAMIAKGADGATSIDNMNLIYGAARATGRILLAADGTPNGALKADVDDLGAFQALLGMPLAGSLKANITFAPRAGDVVASIKASGRNLVFDATKASALDVDATVDRLMSAPSAQGSVRVVGAQSGSLTFGTITADATSNGQSTRLDLRTSVAGANLATTATVAMAGGDLTVGLERLNLAARGESLTLARPVTIALRNGSVALPETVLASRGGRITLAGQAGQSLNLRADLQNVPASLAAVVAPDLGLAGSISGSASVRGPASAPAVTYQLDWRGAALAATRNAGLPPLTISAKGATQNNRVSVDGNIASRDLNLRVDGSAPLGQGDLALHLAGAVPASLLNQMMVESGATFRGAINVDVRLAGPAAEPRITGTVATSGASFNDPGSGLTLKDITLRAQLDGKQVVLREAQANSAAGGSLRAEGTVGIDPATGMPANIRIRADRFRINDRRIVDGEIGADLTLTGPLASRPVLKGRVDIGRMNISVPEQLPKSIADLKVAHVNAPPAIQARVDKQKAREESSPGLPIALDVTVNGGNQIFVRGRGLDVVLGGTVRITGTAAAPVGIGAFELRRGHLSVVGKRLTFTEGRVDFLGSFDPELNFAAQSAAGGITAVVRVTGKASEPKFAFESTPPLPQDQVLARLIFDKPLDQLTPLQVGQLSMEVARLGGLGGGPGLLDELRKGLGVDVLEVTGDADKNTAAVSAGKYVNDNVYVGVKQSTDGTSSAVVDLNVTRNIELRGEVGSDGSSKLGVGVEWDY